MKQRRIKNLIAAQTLPEGRGMTVHRTIGTRSVADLDPFLLLDEMDMPQGSNGAGFPEHPHRGFETVTYMLEGQMEHRDQTGSRGIIGPGDTQWMTAGRGIVHSEMPVASNETLRGFQLWVNLPAAQKMIAPRYQDIGADQLPFVQGAGYTAKLLAGDLLGERGPISEVKIQPFFADIRLTKDGTITLPVQLGHTAFLYGIDSDLTVAGMPVPSRTLAVLTGGDSVQITGKEGTRFILVSAQPIGEPIARMGPFVMNTRAEIKATVRDWNNGTFLRQEVPASQSGS
ncbi:MAG: pirin family protein [Kordiimonadaceae bacterium]|nr:pirin family protein [Kordiimonadaceae bacterium]